MIENFEVITINEFIGTAILVLIGCGIGALGSLPKSLGFGAGNWMLTAFGWGMAVFVGASVAWESGAHLNPAVSIAFALRRDFPWSRVPGYIVTQLLGATLACLFLRAVVGVSAVNGSNYPAATSSPGAAFWMELVLTFGLVSTILGTSSGAQSVGVLGGIGVGGYIILAGLWASPISGASMNPARTFGPDLVGGDFTAYWVYVAGPLAGALLAVGAAFVLRGADGGRVASEAAQGVLDTIVHSEGASGAGSARAQS